MIDTNTGGFGDQHYSQSFSHSMRKNNTFSTNNIQRMKDKIMTFKSELKIKSKGLVVLESGLQDKNEKMTAMRTLMNRTVTQLDEKRETIEQEFWLKKEKLEEQLNQIKKSNEENLKELKAKAELQKLK